MTESKPDFQSTSVPNVHLSTIIMASLEEDGPTTEWGSRTELDSHANMPVVGKYCHVIQKTGKTVDVNPFTPAYDPLRGVPLVDAALLHLCPFTGKECLLIIRNALYVPSMDNNLLPPFIIREAGVIINDTPKIHIDDPDENDHAIIFSKQNFRIPLKLWGIFSYFDTLQPTENQLQTCKNAYLLTPEHKWDPHTDVYAQNEDSLLDWEGNVKQPKDRIKIIIDEIQEDVNISQAMSIGAVEMNAVDQILNQLETNDDAIDMIPPSEVSPMYDMRRLACELEKSARDGKFKASIGSTVTYNKEYLFEDPPDSDTNSELDDDDIDDLMEFNGDPEIMIGAAHARPRRAVDATHLSKIWRISHEQAKNTIEVTSQHNARQSQDDLSKNYTTNDRMLRYKRIQDYFFMDTFYATSKKCKSTRGNKYCQLFVTDKGFVYVVPMRTRNGQDVLQAVKQFTKEIGAPESIVCDNSGEQSSHEMKSFCAQIGTTLRFIEEGTPWTNKAELYIGLIKEAVRKDMKEANCPLVLWDYCVERRARINNLTAKGRFNLHGTNAYTALTSDEGDISNLCQYKFYDWCYYREHTAGFPFNKEVMGRILGPARGEGNEMAQWVLKANGRVVPRRTTRPLNDAELCSSSEVEKRQVFDQLIMARLGSSVNLPRVALDEITDLDPYEDDEEEPIVMIETEDVVDASGRLIDQQPAYDKMINAEIQLQQEQQPTMGKVVRRALGPDGKVSGEYNDNPLQNSIVYEVEFPDGQVKEYAANVIAQNMLTQVDHEGYTTTLLAGIIDYKKDPDVAISKSDKYVVTKRGQRRLRRSTLGWKLLVQWKDGSEVWIPLKDLKESHPIETAEFAKSQGIDDEVAFAYWVPYTLRKRDAIISAVKSRYTRRTHKFGVRVPMTVKEAYAIDAYNENHLWRDAIKKEMTNVGVAFQVLDDNESLPVGSTPVTGHMIFDVKMDMTRKARWVLDGHKTPSPEVSTYAGVVSRESVRIALTYAALNGLDVTAADIRNAYLQAPSSRKDYILCGPEFGIENLNKRALIKRALYGGKTAGRDFRNHLRACMMHLKFKPCLADPDVWMRTIKKSDGTPCYEYVLLYTDDVLVISENGEKVLREGIGKYFELKEESIGPPKIYLGGHMRKVQLDNGVQAWAFSSSKYVSEAVNNVESYLERRNMKLPKKAETPIQTSYRPELDVTPELNSTDAAYYQSLVGTLRWIVELGRVDICLELSMMSSHLALPREGHLSQIYNIFAYLKKHHNTEMVFDPSDPVINEEDFAKQDWTSSEFGHVEGQEILPATHPEPRGQGFRMIAKVDADHAGDSTTRRSRTGFIIYLNSAPIYWMSKKQISVESSSFGSEFVAMKQCCEYIRGLRYKLRMMGIPIIGHTYVYGDNQSVLFNTTIPDSTLKKKSQSIAYHFIREGVARNEWRTAYVNTNENEADLLTKVLPSSEKRRNFVRRVLHHIFGYVL